MGNNINTAAFSKAADNNKDHILGQLRSCLRDGDRVLEIASGTGQHALHFNEYLPTIEWQPTDVDIDAYGLRETLAEHLDDKLLSPFSLDVSNWPVLRMNYDAIYSSNCLHIIDTSKVEAYIAGVGKSLNKGGQMLIYGPFKYDGKFTTESNEKFDGFLRTTYPGGCIKDFKMIDDLAKQSGFVFESDTQMPANNQFLRWRWGVQS